MATYLSRSNVVQADALQTLYLMNPSCTGYSDSSSQGNMVLISPTTTAVGQGSSLGHPVQQHQQQHYVEFSLPVHGLTQLPLPQQSHIATLSNSNMGHQNAASNTLSNSLSNRGYSWNGGNEVSFLHSRDMAEDNQPLPARHNFMNAGQQSTSGMSQYGLRTSSQTSIQEQPTLIPNGAALGLNMENLQASTGAGQILSLSLSPQRSSVIQLPSFPMQHSGATVSGCPGYTIARVDHDPSNIDRFSNKCIGGSLSSFRGSSGESMLGTGVQNQVNGAGSNRLHIMPDALPIEIYGSKYLRAAQQLLNEMVSVGSVLKRNTFKYAQLVSSMGPGSISDGALAQGRNLGGTNGNHGPAVVSWSGKDVAPTVTALPSCTPGLSEHTTENVVQLAQAGRQELQTKKAKLMAMLDEVDQRYKQYYQQMQIVVASFESGAGLGAARTYTALALQTISKHFRCLRDAIGGQIRVTCRALGEEEISGPGRGEASQLRFVDRQMRQQHALQQFGMMQQHAWRPQRGLPEHAVSVLRTWLFEHFLHPYPKDSDKVLLARQTGLSRNQVSNWFINARVRLWKPMVEEMYSEELREEGMQEADTSVQDGGENIIKGSGLMDSSGYNESKKVINGNEEGFPDQRHESEHASDMHQSKSLIGSSSENFFFCEREMMRQGVKKARTGILDSASMLSPDLSINGDCKPDETLAKGILGHDIIARTENRQKEDYGVSNSGFVKTDHQNIGNYGSFQINGLNRISQEALAANSGVSLTLGLQHCEGGLSLSGAQQHYTQGQGQLIATGRRQECGGTAADYYGMSGHAGGHSSSYEAMNLQNRKRFATHTFHQDRVD